MEPSTASAVNYDAVKVIVDLVQFLVIGGVGVWAWLVRRNDDTAEQVAQHGEKIATLEAQIKGVPGHDDLETLRSEISETRGAIERANGELVQISKTLSLIQEHLLRGGRGS